MGDRYYSSVFGGQVCRDCGSVVMDIPVHDKWHLDIDETLDELTKGWV